MSIRTLKLVAVYVGIAFINVGIAKAVCSTSNPPDPQNPETTDIIFVIDGSGSVDTEFNLQKQGVIDSICGAGAFIPADGSTAIAVIQFSDAADLRVEVELTVLDNTNIDDICTCIDNISQIGNGTELLPALQKAEWIFDNEALGAQRFLVVSTDANITDDVNSVLQECQDLRTATTPVQICTVLVGWGCTQSPPLQDFLDAEDFMKDCANADGRHAGEPIGNYSCASDASDYGVLCEECLCHFLHAGETDCDSNGVPDICEPDCNNNSIGDVCDIRDGTSVDCNSNDIPDECEPECNTNGIDDACDIDCGTAGGECDVPGCGQGTDCNGNSIPDECETNGLYIGTQGGLAGGGGEGVSVCGGHQLGHPGTRVTCVTLRDEKG